MRARINFITLAVDDLERSLTFYRDGLGWRSDGIVGTEFHDEMTGADGAIAFVTLDNDGLVLGLYGRADLAKDAQVATATAASGGHSIGILADSADEVDAMLAVARRAGATMPAPPPLRPFGVYSGYFADPDGHLWEVAYNANPSGPSGDG
jgi:catechol 2,3-dioxygenase-like lactoylglutathione lyase family enzyme